MFVYFGPAVALTDFNESMINETFMTKMLKSVVRGTIPQTKATIITTARAVLQAMKDIVKAARISGTTIMVNPIHVVNFFIQSLNEGTPLPDLRRNLLNAVPFKWNMTDTLQEMYEGRLNLKNYCIELDERRKKDAVQKARQMKPFTYKTHTGKTHVIPRADPWATVKAMESGTLALPTAGIWSGVRDARAGDDKKPTPRIQRHRQYQRPKKTADAVLPEVDFDMAEQFEYMESICSSTVPSTPAPTPVSIPKNNAKHAARAARIAKRAEKETMRMENIANEQRRNPVVANIMRGINGQVIQAKKPSVPSNRTPGRRQGSGHNKQRHVATVAVAPETIDPTVTSLQMYFKQMGYRCSEMVAMLRTFFTTSFLETINTSGVLEPEKVAPVELPSFEVDEIDDTYATKSAPMSKKERRAARVQAKINGVSIPAEAAIVSAPIPAPFSSDATDFAMMNDEKEEDLKPTIDAGDSVFTMSPTMLIAHFESWTKWQMSPANLFMCALYAKMESRITPQAIGDIVYYILSDATDMHSVLSNVNEFVRSGIENWNNVTKIEDVIAKHPVLRNIKTMGEFVPLTSAEIQTIAEHATFSIGLKFQQGRIGELFRSYAKGTGQEVQRFNKNVRSVEIKFDDIARTMRFHVKLLSQYHFVPGMTLYMVSPNTTPALFSKIGTVVQQVDGVVTMSNSFLPAMNDRNMVEFCYNITDHRICSDAAREAKARKDAQTKAAVQIKERVAVQQSRPTVKTLSKHWLTEMISDLRQCKPNDRDARGTIMKRFVEAHRGWATERHPCTDGRSALNILAYRLQNHLINYDITLEKHQSDAGMTLQLFKALLSGESAPVFLELFKETPDATFIDKLTHLNTGYCLTRDRKTGHIRTIPMPHSVTQAQCWLTMFKISPAPPTDGPQEFCGIPIQYVDSRSDATFTVAAMAPEYEMGAIFGLAPAGAAADAF